MIGETVFPALRCRMGEWIYYATRMRFSEIADSIKRTDEVFTSKRLADYVQRVLDSKHTAGIAQYLRSQPQRFFNALVVGVYGGTIDWAPLRLSSETGAWDLGDAQVEDLSETVGLLRFSGEQKLFAIDGQHRVAGIKRAVREAANLGRDEVVVLFVAYEDSPVGRTRTRRLFTTLNKTAKKVTEGLVPLLSRSVGMLGA